MTPEDCYKRTLGRTFYDVNPRQQKQNHNKQDLIKLNISYTAKGIIKEDQNTTYSLGENICKWVDQRGLHFHIIPSAQQLSINTTNNPILKLGMESPGGPVAGSLTSKAGVVSSAPIPVRSRMPLSNCVRMPDLVQPAKALQTQFSSAAQSCPTLCNPMGYSTPGLRVHHQLLEFTQTHVHQVDDAIQPSHPLSSPSPAAFNLSQHQSLCK